MLIYILFPLISYKSTQRKRCQDWQRSLCVCCLVILRSESRYPKPRFPRKRSMFHGWYPKWYLHFLGPRQQIVKKRSIVRPEIFCRRSVTRSRWWARFRQTVLRFCQRGISTGRRLKRSGRWCSSQSGMQSESIRKHWQSFRKYSILKKQANRIIIKMTSRNM